MSSTFTDDDFLAAIAPPTSSHAEARIKLGFHPRGSGGNKDNYQKTFDRLQPDISHFNKMSKSAIYGTSLETKIAVNYEECKKSAQKRDHSFNISFELFSKLVLLPCYFCGNIDTVNDKGFVYTSNGIDRLNNDIGYETDNCVSACGKCNMSKHKRTEKDFIEHCIRVADYQKYKNGMFITAAKEIQIDNNFVFTTYDN